MLTRRTPLRRRAPLACRCRLRPRSSKPSAARRRKAQDGPQAALCRTLPCACGCGRGPSEAHHEPTRARGGKDEHTVPLWWECHARRHRTTARAFWASCGRDPKAIQAGLQAQIEGRA